MKLSAFFISLAVKDLKVSQGFYENLDFGILAGSHKSNYLIMKNEDSLIGLFKGMFEGNLITFNPDWNSDGKNIEQFDDARDIQKKKLKQHSIKLETEVDETKAGPGSLNFERPRWQYHFY